MKVETLLMYINQSFLKYMGRNLPSPDLTSDFFEWIDQFAPYHLLAHKHDVEPTFIYANQQAIKTFGYTLDEFLNLKSKLSASEIDRAERSRLLNIVQENGIAMNYKGPRVKKNGDLFMIQNGIVWKIFDDQNQEIGHAALFWLEEKLPEWAGI
ncbi:MEKHLA domain-containing protein [Acinetobacter sp. ANC 3832]|uniref:MEKHLA domain-containing protein n=1 Tax=Acinetobacter sp. ANC 3832 TaxID=1977874 RepID=UPI000A349806|nr:MEKHLA domain-containing protein [Acinetobacter sp. ANC 3832]OTG92866.1 hypothetical protein B9T35_12200 [Acinetobacter sp. ANC 3832]